MSLGSGNPRLGERMVADPVDSPDYSTFARRRACGAAAQALRGGGGAARCVAGAVRGWALFGLEPDFGSEVKIEAWRALSFKVQTAEGLPPADASVAELDSSSIAGSTQGMSHV